MMSEEYWQILQPRATTVTVWSAMATSAKSATKAAASTAAVTTAPTPMSPNRLQYNDTNAPSSYALNNCSCGTWDSSVTWSILAYVCRDSWRDEPGRSRRRSRAFLPSSRTKCLFLVFRLWFKLEMIQTNNKIMSTTITSNHVRVFRTSS